MLIIFLVVFLGALIQYYEKSLPPFIPQLYRYGKFSYSGPARLVTARVPKRWFVHFYVFSSIISTLVLLLMLWVYTRRESAPAAIQKFLDIFGGGSRKANVSATSAFVAAILCTMQCWKRFYETSYVSVFSNSTMDIGHYLLGYIHYFGVIVSLMIETPGFTHSPGKFDIALNLKEVNYVFIIEAMIFLLFWWMQLDSAKILANLRKDKKGNVVTNKHLIPRGGLFEYVSSPHLFCEIMLYVTLGLILLGNSSFPFIIFWVVSNQVFSAVLTHQWYKSQFPDYPKDRKILVPLLF